MNFKHSLAYTIPSVRIWFSHKRCTDIFYSLITILSTHFDFRILFPKWQIVNRIKVLPIPYFILRTICQLKIMPCLYLCFTACVDRSVSEMFLIAGLFAHRACTTDTCIECNFFNCLTLIYRYYHRFVVCSPFLARNERESSEFFV